MSNLQAENLFRRQAIQSLRQKLPGRPICLMPKSWTWLGLLVALLFLSAAIFLGTVDYARKESARGWLVSSPGVVRIAHSRPALVQRIVRSAGERVEVGEPLIYLSGDSLLPGGNSKLDELLQQLRHDLVEVDSQLELSLRQEELDSGSLQVQLRKSDAEIASLVEQVDEQRRQVAVSRDQLQRLRNAAEQAAVTEWEVLRQQQNLGELQQRFNALQQSLASQQRNREAINNREEGVPILSRINRSDLRLQRSRLLQQIAEHESARLSVIRSPVTGTIASVIAQEGNLAAAQKLLMTILPENFELNAEIYVPSRAAGLIRPGQEVRLLYDAFPQQEFGAFRGSISHISEFVVLPADLPQPFQLPEASYKLSVAIHDTEVMTEIGVARLRPGMLLFAEIMLEKRKLFDWLLAPLSRGRGQRPG